MPQKTTGPGPELAGGESSGILSSALAGWQAIAARLAGRPLALLLDYDGTLSPIAARPELALLPEATRALLARLARRYPVAILSGRARADVAALVGLQGLTYAGSHGLDIAGPPAVAGGPPLRHEVGQEVLGSIAAAAERLARELSGIPGVLVEPKRFAVAVHYRLARDADLPRIEAAVDAVARSHPELRKAPGKKVFELRPALAWDKGAALEWLLERWGGPLPLYVGDDATDEDAFAAAARRGGIGILVAGEPRPSAASFALRDPGEVQELLARLAE